jgi:ribose/xylose/arabinose/galactoside ABC-type transport system permease subunit
LTEKKDSVFKRYENLTPLTVLLVFAVVIVLMQIILSMSDGNLRYPTFIAPVNLLNILMQVAVPGIVAIGMTMVIISGGIDLSVGMLASLVSIFVALGMAKWGMSPVQAVVGGILLATICGGLMGFIISWTKVEPFIITLGGMMAFQGVALLLCNSREVTLQGQLDGFKINLIEGAKDPVTSLNLIIPIYVVIFLLLFVLFWLIMKYTKFGRRIYAVGCNSQAAYLSGVNVKNIKLLVYLVNGALVGIGAVMLLARINVGIITLGQNLEIDVIAMVIIGGTAMAGGKGNIWGTFIGALLLGSISNAMNMLRLPSQWQYVAKGVIIIASVTLAAVSGGMSTYWEHLKARFIKTAE